MSNLDPRFLNDVEARAVEMCMDIAVGVLEQLIVDGLAYGDEPLSDAEFIPMYLDKRASGALEMLPTVNPQMAEDMRRQFERAVAKGVEAQ